MSHSEALSLISGYGSDSDDSGDDIPSSKESVKIESSNEKPSKKQKLPLPESVLPIRENEVEDNVALHEGRIRSFPHERGIWSTSVYIPCNHTTNEVLLHFVSFLSDLEEIKLTPVDNFHISLTKTVILRHHWIDSFVKTIKDAIAEQQFRKFIAIFGELEVYVNEEKTRTFLGLKIGTGYDTLFKLTKRIDKCLQEFDLPTFYENASFHMSLVWCLDDCESVLRSLLPQLNAKLAETLSKESTIGDDENWCLDVDHILCKSGNKFFEINLL